jgi:hypothetical protein
MSHIIPVLGQTEEVVMVILRRAFYVLLYLSLCNAMLCYAALLVYHY